MTISEEQEKERGGGDEREREEERENKGEDARTRAMAPAMLPSYFFPYCLFGMVFPIQELVKREGEWERERETSA